MNKFDEIIPSGLQPALAEISRRPKRRGSLHGTAVEALRTMIVSGKLAPGDPLREVELCEELGISRTPLREAIRTLAREGLVRLYPNRSAVVAGFDYEEIESLYEMVSNLEVFGAKLACARATDDQIDEVRALHHQMLVYFFQRDLPKYIESNKNIHRAVMRLSNNKVLLEIWELLLPRVERARTSANLNLDRWQAAVQEHEAMIAAFTARDVETLTGLISQHYFNGLETLRASPDGPAPSP